MISMYNNYPDSAFRKEDSFIIKCLDFFVTGNKFLSNDALDWRYIIKKTTQHRIIPAMYFYFSRMTSSIPPQFLSYFRQANQHITFNSFILTKELLAMLALFRENNIKAVAFKGPMLCNSCFVNLGTREFTDLDILVTESDLFKVKKALGNLGAIEDTEIQPDHACSYLIPGTNMPINLDIHWRFAESAYGFEYSTEAVFSRLKSIQFFNQEILSLSPEDTFISTVIHHSKNEWKELRYVADIGGLITKQKELDWNFLLNESANMEIKRNLLLAVYLARRTFTVNLPNWVEETINNDAGISSLGTTILGQHFGNIQVYTPGYINFDFDLQNLLHPKINSFFFIKDKISFLITPNPLDKKIIKLPNHLSFIYYFIRFVRLIKTYGLGRVLSPVMILLKSSVKTMLRAINNN